MTGSDWVTKIKNPRKMKKRLLCCYFLCTTFLLIGQIKEKKNFEFGLVFGFKYNNLKTELSDWNALGIANSINSLETENRLGFDLGLLYKFNLTDHFAIVPQTILSFQNSTFKYDLTNEISHQEIITPVAVNIPLHFVFTRPLNKKINPSVLLGIRYIVDITDYDISDFDLNTPFDEFKLRLQKQSTALDLGIGAEIKTKKFNLKPELLYSLGLEDFKGTETDIFNTAIASLHQDKIGIRILFYK